MKARPAMEQSKADRPTWLQRDTLVKPKTVLLASTARQDKMKTLLLFERPYRSPHRSKKGFQRCAELFSGRSRTQDTQGWRWRQSARANTRASADFAGATQANGVAKGDHSNKGSDQRVLVKIGDQISLRNLTCAGAVHHFNVG